MPNNVPHNALRRAVNRTIANGAPVYVNQPAPRSFIFHGGQMQALAIAWPDLPSGLDSAAIELDGDHNLTLFEGYCDTQDIVFDIATIPAVSVRALTACALCFGEECGRIGEAP